jgi:dienelactone hydrolase
LIDTPRVTPLREDGLVGELFEPERAPFPALLVLGGSDGGLGAAAEYAAALACHGFAALALAYFGAPGLPAALTEIELGYFDRALAWLGRRPGVDRARIGVVGRSRGGELALLIGASSPVVRAVVAHVPSALRWSGSVGGAAAWVRDGVAPPFLVANGDMGVRRAEDGRILVSSTPRFEAALEEATEVELEAASTTIEETRGPILLLGAADDGVWPSGELVSRAAARLGRHGRRGDEHAIYADAGHGGTWLPADPSIQVSTLRLATGVEIELGGTPDGNARAQRDAWRRVLDFLGRSLG